MERNSIGYKVRRKMQTAAHHLFSDDAMSKFYYCVVLKKKLNLSNPQTFNEKLQWLKLYVWPNNPLVVQCADKYAVRDYVREKGYGEKLVPLLGEWDDAREIPWNELPKQFVLKCNHGCAYNIVVSDKDAFDREDAVRQLNRWLKEDFGAFNIETHYSRIKKHRVLCEEFLGAPLTDYKFFCFNGKPNFIYVSNDLVHDRQAQIGFFNLDGSKMPLKRDDYADIASIELPAFYDEMREAAEKLAQDFPFVRVDFFVANKTYYFAELTFTPGACMMPIEPEYFDAIWGEELDLREVQVRYGNGE